MLLFFNHKIVFLAVLLSMSNLAAGQNFKKAYKKAYSYAQTNSDSCLKYTQIAKTTARNDQQRYKTFYIAGYVSSNVGLLDLSLENYQKALKYAHSPNDKGKAYIAIGWRLFDISEKDKAEKIANECIKYFAANDIKEDLSYAYDLKANILLDQYNQKCISFFEKSLNLKKEDEKGIVYHQIAKAFYRFGKVDKAIHYQRLAVDKFPLKSPDYKAKNWATLAKYLINKGNLGEAANAIEKADLAGSKGNEGKAIVHQAWVLYYLASGKAAIANYARFDALMSNKVREAKNANDKKAYCKTAIELYKELLNAKPNDQVKSKSKAKLDVFRALLAGIDSGIELKRKEEMFRRIYENELEKQKNKKGGSNLVWWFFFAAITVVAGLLARLLSTRKEVQEFKRKNAIIARIEHITKTIINDENKTIIELLASGESYKNIALTMDLKEQTIRRRMIRLAEKANKTDIRHLF